MKTRIGFVSNSSSSSFVAAIKKDAFDRELANIDNDLHKRIIEHLFDDDSAFGYDVKTFNEYDTHGHGSWEYQMDDFDWGPDGKPEDVKDEHGYSVDPNDPDEIVHNFIDKFNIEECFCTRVDF